MITKLERKVFKPFYLVSLQNQSFIFASFSFDTICFILIEVVVILVVFVFVVLLIVLVAVVVVCVVKIVVVDVGGVFKSKNFGARSHAIIAPKKRPQKPPGSMFFIFQNNFYINKNLLAMFFPITFNIQQETVTKIERIKKIIIILKL